MDWNPHRCRQVCRPHPVVQYSPTNSLIAKLEAVNLLLEKLTGDLEKSDLTTERQCLSTKHADLAEYMLLTVPQNAMLHWRNSKSTAEIPGMQTRYLRRRSVEA